MLIGQNEGDSNTVAADSSTMVAAIPLTNADSTMCTTGDTCTTIPLATNENVRRRL